MGVVNAAAVGQLRKEVDGQNCAAGAEVSALFLWLNTYSVGCASRQGQNMV